jgi:hypothetical protein
VVTSGLTQGIGVATGLQDKFSWAGVAAAGVASGVGGWIGGGPIISGMAGGIAGAAAESLITGNDFGDTLMQNLPSIIGNTIGGLVADKVAGGGRSSGSGGGSGSVEQNEPVLGEGGGSGSSDDAGFGDIVVTAQLRDAVYRPSDYGSLFQLAQYRPNPRSRMGGNGGPPLNDPLVITQVFRVCKTHPAERSLA